MTYRVSVSWLQGFSLPIVLPQLFQPLYSVLIATTSEKEQDEKQPGCESPLSLRAGFSLHLHCGNPQGQVLAPVPTGTSTVPCI